MKKCLFSFDLNSAMDSALRTTEGIPFHRKGDKLLNARWPSKFLGMPGRTRKFSVLERRLLDCLYSDIKPLMFAGELPFTIFQAKF